MDLGPIEQAQIAVSSNSATSPIPSSSSSFPSDEISVPPPVPPKSQSLENHIENHEEDESSTTANNSLTTLSSSTPIVITRSSPPPPPLKSASSHDHHQAAEIVEENDDDKPLGQHMQTLLPLPTKSSMKRTQFQQQHILLPQPTTTAATTTINTTASSSPPVIIDDDDDSFDFSDDLSEIPSIHVKFNELVAVHTIEHISYNDYDDDENDNMGGDYLRDTPRRSIWKRASVRIQKVFRTPSRKYSRCSGDDNDTDLGVADENVIHKNDGLEGRTGGGGGDAIIPVVLSQDTILETSSSSAVLASSSTNSSHGVTPQTHANDYNRRASLDVNNFDGYRAEVEIPEEEEDELDMAAATTNLPQKHYYRPSLDVSGISGREGIYDEVYDTAKTSAVKRTSLTHTLKRLMPTIRKRHSSSTTTSATANSTIEEMRVDPHTLLDLNFQVGSLLSNNLDSSTPSSSSYAVSSTPPVPSMPTTSLTTTNSMIDAKDFNDLYAQLVLGRRATTLEQTSRPLVRELSIRRTMLPEQRFSRVSFDLLSADDDIMLTLNYVESF